MYMYILYIISMYMYLYIYTGELGYDGPLYDGLSHMTDNILGPSPMHIKYVSCTVKLVMFACSKYCVFFIFSFMRVLINANLHQVRYLKQKGQIYACFNYCVLMHSH